MTPSPDLPQPHVLVMAGYGINCEEETRFAFERAGAHATIVHINDVIDRHVQLGNYQLLALPGGFSYGDDTGSGKAFASKIKNYVWEEVRQFIEGDRLVIGICNGFQILTNLGLIPALDGQYGTPQAALVHNEGARYLDRWVDLQFQGNNPWTQDIGMISLPIAHGEGKFYAEPGILTAIKAQGLIAARYTSGEVCAYQHLSVNPNGALEDIAGITDPSGKILGLMPHPERAMFFTQLPHWPILRETNRRRGLPCPEEGPGMKLFRNAVAYFQ